MARKLSSIAPDWWDYTTLEDGIIRDAAALTPEKRRGEMVLVLGGRTRSERAARRRDERAG